jgi:anti-sigma factor RsiW
MSCGEARRLCWPDGSPRALDDSTAAAEAHIAECAACRAFIAEMREMAELLAAASPQASAPRDVRERVFSSLERARLDRGRRRSRRLFLRGLSVAGVAAVIVFGVWQSRTAPTGSADIGAQVAEDHRRELQGTGITTTDSTLIGQWLSARVGFTVRIPAFSNGQLVGARVADVDGARGAVLAYRVDGQDVSYYLIPAQSTSPGRAINDDPVVQVSNRSGLGIAAWDEPSLTHVLVGNLPGTRLSELAHECIRQMMALGENPDAIPAAFGGGPAQVAQVPVSTLLSDSWLPTARGFDVEPLV